MISEDKLILFNKSIPDNRFERYIAIYIGHRAIGVVYHPERDRGNYVPTLLPSRYDALIFLDKTMAPSAAFETRWTLNAGDLPFDFKQLSMRW